MNRIQKIGVLLVNLGTPDSPSAGDVRRYLREFLWDRRVVDLPRWMWWPILHGFVLPIRPIRSARAYRKIWTAQGSPLLLYSQAQCQALRQRLDPERFELTVAMRYGQPSIAQGLHHLKAAHCQKLLVFPLYPQYSSTTTASVFDAVANVFKSWRHIPHWRMIDDYALDPGYIQALRNSVQNFQRQYGQPERLIFSFHGIPQRYADEGDPYPQRCHATAQALAQTLGLNTEQWQLSFQSRMGKAPWLQPYTSESMQRLAQSGVRHVQVLCPGFSADCLETLEEIALENRAIFLEAGGEKYEYIPCLNAGTDHIRALADLIETHTGDWHE